MALRRDDWLDLARKVDWEYTYVTEREVFPEVVAGEPWLPHSAWAEWEEAYRSTYREYVETQLEKDNSVFAVRDVLSKAKITERLDPGWMQLAKFHNGAIALGEYAACIGELRMARFGRDSAWRAMANLGALDEIRHCQIPLILSHDLLKFDPNFDWAHKAYHTNQWAMVAAKHLFDDMFTAASATDTALQLTFVFETGFTNLQFIAMAAMADGANDHVFEKALASIQTDESRHAQQGHPVLRAVLENGGKEQAQFLLDKMWWRSYRLFLALTGTSMDYLTPVGARKASFKEFMVEWIMDQFVKNLEEFGLELPWFWDLFVEELDYSHHSFQLGLYQYRQTLWIDEPMPSPEDRAWLEEKYPTWGETFGPIWDQIEQTWDKRGVNGTLPYTLPSLCNLCQLPTAFLGPKKLTACTGEYEGRNYLFCSEPCKWIFFKQPERFAGHKTVVDRVLGGEECPSDYNSVLEWMGMESIEEQGRDLHNGEHPWRVDAKVAASAD